MARFLGWAWAPVIASVVWFATILGLLIWWLAQGHPDYRNDEATVVFISDVGAEHKALFIAGAAVTGFFYPLSLFAERWLRHVDKLPTTKKRREKAAGWIGIIFACYGSLALLLLTILDAFNHSTAHWILTAIFVVCVAISAISQAIEILHLRRANRGIDFLKRSARLKIVLISIVLVAAIIFASCYGVCDGNSYGRNGPGDAAAYPHCRAIVTTAAVAEWFIAFMFSIYLLTFVIDLLPYIEKSVTKPGATTADMPHGPRYQGPAGVTEMKPSDPKTSAMVPTS